MKKEIWKDIKDYEGLYQVSNLGRVKRLAFTRKIYARGYEQLIHYKEHLIKTRISNSGYNIVALSKNAKKVQNLLAKGISKSQIAKILGVQRSTLRRFIDRML